MSDSAVRFLTFHFVFVSEGFVTKVCDTKFLMTIIRRRVDSANFKKVRNFLKCPFEV